MEYKVTERGIKCGVVEELDRLERYGLIEKNVTRETKPVKTKNPDIKVALDYYHDQFYSKFKEKPDIKGAKDASIVSRVVNKYGIEKYKHMINIFLMSEDDFISKSGRTLGVFSSVINKLLLNETPRTKTGKALRAIADWRSEQSNGNGANLIDVEPVSQEMADPKEVQRYLADFGDNFGDSHTWGD